MLEVDGVLALALLGLWIYCIFDVVTTDESLVRNLPKFLWLMIVIFLPDIGSIVWLVAGRPERSSFRIGDTSARSRRYIAPEDRPDFGVDLDKLSLPVREREEQAQLRLREEQLRRREEELRRREEAMRRENPPPPTES